MAAFIPQELGKASWRGFFSHEVAAKIASDFRACEKQVRTNHEKHFAATDVDRGVKQPVSMLEARCFFNEQRSVLYHVTSLSGDLELPCDAFAGANVAGKFSVTSDSCSNATTFEVAA